MLEATARLMAKPVKLSLKNATPREILDRLNRATRRADLGGDLRGSDAVRPGTAGRKRLHDPSRTIPRAWAPNVANRSAARLGRVDATAVCSFRPGQRSTTDAIGTTGRRARAPRAPRAARIAG